MKTSAIFFGFDSFGSAGCAEGAHLLADELRDILADNRRETVPIRARAYTRQVSITEVDFPTLKSLNTWREDGQTLASQALAHDRLLWVAGNHLGVLPVYDALTEADLVFQFDAHLDIHHFHDCTKELSHGNFVLHLRSPAPRLVNVGHRDLLLTKEYIDRHYLRSISAAELQTRPATILEELTTRAHSADRVILDLDCDVFDPAYFPAVSRPVPFGLSPSLLLTVLEALWSDRIRAVCLSEFDPGRDRDNRSLAVVLWLIEYLLLRFYEPTTTPVTSPKPRRKPSP